MPKFIVVDGNSLLYRAYFAMPALSNTRGEPTHAVFGFATMIFRLLEQERPDAILVAWDAPARTFRHEQFEAYKAHRPQTPDDLGPQFEPARQLVRALGIPAMEEPGFEADDCVGTIAARAAAAGYDVLIVTGDNDALQLVTDRVHVLTTRRGVTDTIRYTPELVEEKLGVRPDQVVDYKALKGDASDNISGVKGIGEKTAARLLQQFGHLDALYEHLDQVQDPRTRVLLEAGRGSAYLSRSLCTIRTDTPCVLDPSACPPGAPDTPVLQELLNHLEFRSLLPRIASLWPDRSAGDALPAEARTAPQITLPEGAELRDRLAALLKSPRLALAVHGEPGEPMQGIALSAGEGATVYVPWGDEALQPLLREALALRRIEKLGHDLKRALRAVSAAGAELGPIACDTMVAAYVLNSNRASPSVASLCSDWLHYEIPAVASERRSLFEDVDAARSRTASEALAAWELATILEERLQAQDLWSVYERLENPLIPILASMEALGVQIDVQALQVLSNDLSRRIAALETEVFELAGTRFNIGSTKQLQEILFERLGLPSGKKTKTGLSTGSDVLEELAPAHPIVAKILAWRELSKLKSTYADSLPRLIDSQGRVHTSLNQAVAATGRLSSSDPNLQNIPVRTEVGREIRRAFTAPPGHRLVSADYSQIELRILAHVTGDPELVRTFREDRDIHATTATRLFGVPTEEVTADMRRRAKTINFAVLYGMTDFTLSRELGITVAEARRYSEEYFNGFPGVRAFMDETRERVRQTGAVRTLFGRRRSFPDINSPNRSVRLFAERSAINSPIQGAAADIIKLAMIRVHDRLTRERCPARLLLQVHDELLFEAPAAAVPRCAALIQEEMEHAADLAVRVKADVKAGPNWADMEPVLEAQP